MTAIGSDIIAILATLFCIWLLRPLAIRVGFVDRPGGRKQHQQEVPLIGGIAIFFGFCFALLTIPISLQTYRGLIAGASLLLIMGVVDDFRELGSKLRLLGQIGVALCLAAWGNLQVTSMGDLFFLGNVQLGIFALPLTVVMVVGFLNAMNMIDGQDGLAGGVSLGQVLLLIYLSWKTHQTMDLYLLTVLGLLLGVFLCFNMPLPWRKQASIFLGDAGSTVTAFIVAWFAISVGQSSSMVKPTIMLWILAFPVFDLLHVSLVRLGQKKPLFLASLDHLHFVLRIAGMNVSISTLMLCLFSFGLGVLGILLNDWQVPEGWQFLGWLLALFIYLLVVKLVRDTRGKSDG